MPTKDPHIALIDAHEKMDHIKLMVKAAREALEAKLAQGYMMTQEDREELASFRRKLIDETRRVQDELFDELSSHGKLDS